MFKNNKEIIKYIFKIFYFLLFKKDFKELSNYIDDGFKKGTVKGIKYKKINDTEYYTSAIALASLIKNLNDFINLIYDKKDCIETKPNLKKKIENIIKEESKLEDVLAMLENPYKQEFINEGTEESKKTYFENNLSNYNFDLSNYNFKYDPIPVDEPPPPPEKRKYPDDHNNSIRIPNDGNTSKKPKYIPDDNF